MVPFIIEKATAKDIPAIQNIAKKYKQELGFVMRLSLERAVEKQELHIARTPQGDVVGFVNWHRRRDNITTVYEIAVAQGDHYKGKGIGKALLMSIPTPVRLKVTQDNPANGFYKHIGMSLIGTETGRKRPLNVYVLGTQSEVWAITHAPYVAREKRRRKQREAKRERYASMTDEERLAYNQRQAEYRQTLSEEKKEAKREYMRQYSRYYHKHMPEEKREAKRQKEAIRAREQFLAMTDEERRAYYDAKNARERKRRAMMTLEEREAYYAKQRRSYRRWISKKPASQRKQYFREKRARRDPVTIVGYNKRYYERKKRARLSSILGA